MSEGKGRPTRKRKEAEVKRGASLAPAKTKEEKRALRDDSRARRLATREAMMRGEESALGVRDRGPARRYVRNMVDARLNIGEIFLPVILISLFLSMSKNPQLLFVSFLTTYGLVLAAIIDGIFFGRRIKKRVREKFPNEQIKGLAMYGFIRSTQMRRMRAPRPQVKRGEKDF